MTAAIALGMSLLPRVPDTDATHRLDFFSAALYPCYARQKCGMGDAGLKMVDTPACRLGCLICWKSYMPLARYALYAQGMEVFINPTWDNGATCLATTARCRAPYEAPD